MSQAPEVVEAFSKVKSLVSAGLIKSDVSFVSDASIP